MKEHPMLFNQPMVRAILGGSKTQTRRVVKPQPFIDDKGHICQGEWCFGMNGDGSPALWNLIRCKSPYKVGDQLWVRETFRQFQSHNECGCSEAPCECPSHGSVIYRATQDMRDGEKWKPSIHMPRWASRITLEITNVRVERLNDISESNAIAEGVATQRVSESDFRYIDYRSINECEKLGMWPETFGTAKQSYMSLWESINGPGSSSANPWVWVIEFERVMP